MTHKEHKDLFEQIKSYAYDYMDNGNISISYGSSLLDCI
jgi:hypothetical protein